MSDMLMWMQDNSEDAVTDTVLPSIESNLINTGAVSDVKSSKTGEHTYEISFDFRDLNTFISRLSSDFNQNLIKITDNSLDISISMENYDTLCSMIPILKDPNLEVYGPVYNNPPYDTRTEEEYLYMIDFIFGSGSQSIKESKITLNYTAPSAIKESNGKTVSQNTVEFSFPLIDFILLHEPIEFYCIW